MNKLENQLKQYKDAIDRSNIVSKTDINGIITFVNDEFCKISGYSKDELIGRPHNIVRHPDMPAESFKALWNHILAKKVHKAIVKNLAKDGRAFYLNTTITPILGENGNIEEFVAIRHDVTEIILLNEKLENARNKLNELNSSLKIKVAQKTKKLQDLNENLEKRIKQEVAKNNEKTELIFRQSRLATMGEMIANIAHQWRQPLNELGIDIFRLKNSVNSDKFDTIYDHAKSVIKSMSNTIEDFRNFFSADTKKENFSLSDALNSALILFQGTLERAKINVKLDVACDCEVYGRKNELVQVIANLISNAKDAFENLNINAKIIKLTLKISENNAIISVEDNAGGIKNEIIDKIFFPYFTTKHQSVGTGLGLYMSKMLIKKFGGDIKVANKNDGTCFNVIIPIKRK